MRIDNEGPPTVPMANPPAGGRAHAAQADAWPWSVIRQALREYGAMLCWFAGVIVLSASLAMRYGIQFEFCVAGMVVFAVGGWIWSWRTGSWSTSDPFVKPTRFELGVILTGVCMLLGGGFVPSWLTSLAGLAGWP